MCSQFLALDDITESTNIDLVEQRNQDSGKVGGGREGGREGEGGGEGRGGGGGG